MRLHWTHLACVFAAILVVGCGGGSDSASVAGSESTSASDPLAKYPKGPTREFIVPGGDNSIQVFGHEGTPAQRKDASAVVESWMHARAAADWTRACRYLGAQTIEESLRDASEITHKKVNDCGKAVGVVMAERQSGRTYNVAGSVASFRVQEGRGYAQYHGREGKDWIVPVVDEGGAWKVITWDPIERLQ